MGTVVLSEQTTMLGIDFLCVVAGTAILLRWIAVPLPPSSAVCIHFSHARRHVVGFPEDRPTTQQLLLFEAN